MPKPKAPLLRSDTYLTENVPGKIGTNMRDLQPRPTKRFCLLIKQTSARTTTATNRTKRNQVLPAYFIRLSHKLKTMTVKFSEKPDQVCVVERIDDNMIDDLFYQDDEIGEFRNYAFMIECGIEEEDWSF